MGHQIIKQPDGLYCVFSDGVNGFVQINATAEDIIEARMEEIREMIVKNVNEIIAKLERGEKPYFQFTMSFDEALKERNRR